jgi:hypothetical protein
MVTHGVIIFEFHIFQENFFKYFFFKRKIKICPREDDNEVLISQECTDVIIIYFIIVFNSKENYSILNLQRSNDETRPIDVVIENDDNFVQWQKKNFLN